MTETRPTLGARDVLRIPDFRRLFVAQAISDVGDGVTFLTLLLTVNQLTHSTAALAVMSIAVALPPVTIGLVAGAYADRLDRRRIMLASDALRGAFVLGFIAVATLERLPALYALAFVQAAIGTFFSPARGALIPRIVPVEGLLAANSISQISRVIASLIGTGLAGVIVGVTGAIWPSFVLDAATFFVSVAIVYGVSRSAGAPEPVGADGHGSIGSSVGAGLRAIGHSRILVGTVVGLGLAMLGLGAINVLFVPFLVNELHETPIWAGPIEGAQTLSMILAGSLVAALAARLRPTSIITGSLVGVAVACWLLAIVPNVLGLMVVLFAVGWFVTPLQAAASTIMQTATADALRGRVFAAFQAVMSTTTIISTAAAGIVADVLGVRTVVGLGGVVVAFGAVASALLYAADRGQAEEAQEPAEPHADPGIAPAA
ncbi:MAG: MFS transporter [Chloroflexi bacterium]|nr:MFS transporter [Chloroflexota bacterium]